MVDCVEKAVEVVQDHEGGTGVGGWHRRPEGEHQRRHRAPSSEDGTEVVGPLGVDAQTRVRWRGPTNPRKAGAQRFRAREVLRQIYERAERDAKVRKAASSCFGSRTGSYGVPRRARSATIEDHGGQQERPTTCDQMKWDSERLQSNAAEALKTAPTRRALTDTPSCGLGREPRVCGIADLSLSLKGRTPGDRKSVV